MENGTKPAQKQCPRCNREYPEDDNFCGVDGTALEYPEAKDAQTASARE